MDGYYVYFARVVGGACDKNHNSFAARGGEKVAHHWYRGIEKDICSVNFNFTLSPVSTMATKCDAIRQNESEVHISKPHLTW